MTNERIREIKSSLKTINSNSKNEQITYEILTLIKENPRVGIDDLKTKAQLEPENLKSVLQQLLELGLIFQLSVGYCLSPLGKYLLNEE